MEKGHSAPQHVKAGTNVHVLFYEESQPHVVNATIGSITPMAFTTSDPLAKRLKPKMRSIIVTDENGTIAKAECRVENCATLNEDMHFQVDVTAWEEVDRRRFKRHEVEMPLRLRMVSEQEGETKIQDVVAVSQDISLGGMLVKSPEKLDPGSLVEVQATLPTKDQIRVLAIVARATGEDCYGIEFLDFVGGSRYLVHGLIESAA